MPVCDLCRLVHTFISALALQGTAGLGGTDCEDAWPRGSDGCALARRRPAAERGCHWYVMTLRIELWYSEKRLIMYLIAVFKTPLQHLPIRGYGVRPPLVCLRSWCCSPPISLPVHFVVAAVQHLRDLGALDSRIELTPLGWHLSRLPVAAQVRMHR
jgi:helicase associated protein